MIRIFKLTLTRHSDGYALNHQVVYFNDSEEYEQCDRNGKTLNEPIFTLSPDRSTITELTNPEALGLSEHRAKQVVNDLRELRQEWNLAQRESRTVFTSLPINAFSDQFFRETIV